LGVIKHEGFDRQKVGFEGLICKFRTAMIVNSKAPINGRRPRDGNSKGKDDGDGGDDDEHRIH
jgi:hypothetical protein